MLFVTLAIGSSNTSLTLTCIVEQQLGLSAILCALCCLLQTSSHLNLVTFAHAKDSCIQNPVLARERGEAFRLAIDVLNLPL